MRFGSVCSGIEAASVAFNPLGWDAAWLAETDLGASAVLAHRYGASKPVFGLDQKSEKRAEKMDWGDRLTNWGDMTRIPELLRSGQAEAPDILCGGTPCQSYSIAGRRKGLSDERGQLTLTFVEIADEIDNARARRGEEPCVIFWENVPGVLTDTGNAFGNYLADLAGDAEPLEPGPRPEHGRSSAHWSWQKKTGEHRAKWPNAGVVVGPRRTVAWRVLDAQYFGLAQRRARLFVVASARLGFHPDEILFEFDGLRRDSQPRRPKGEDLARSVASCADDGCIENGTGQACADGTERDGNLAAGGVAPEVFRLVAFGDYRHDTKSSSINARDHKYVTDIVYHHGNPVVVDGAEDVLAFDTTQLTSPSNYSKPKPGDPCHPLAAGAHPPAICFTSKDHGQDATEEMAPTLRAMAHSASHANGGGQLAVAVPHAFNWQASGNQTSLGVSENITNTLSTSTVQAIAFTERGRPEGRTVETNGDLAYAILAPSGGSRSQEKMIATPSSVRRLMPVECERLQGFPDDHTLVPVAGKMAADGPRYKQLGNSWPVAVVNWIGRRIDRALGDDETFTLDQEAYTWLTAP